ncbi:TetR/AcrR family transcriptional regulator [Luedemannella flava]|uniref:TetR/AcrR family transcriptional regulator n=1 Tax=Luedemannella flava TaxID=349316 RepID=UPI0031E3B317
MDEHRRTVHAAIMNATATLVAEHGLAAVTMSQIAQVVGIGRATLYKYFPDVEAILVAWHERQVTSHLQELTEAAEKANDPGERLRTMVRTYARLSSGDAADRHGPGHHADYAVPLHRATHVQHARHQVHALLADTIAVAATAGQARTDVPAPELAHFCLHALASAHDLRTHAARDRLVVVVLTALGTPPATNDAAPGTAGP